eukprot:sb/3475924/
MGIDKAPSSGLNFLPHPGPLAMTLSHCLSSTERAQSDFRSHSWCLWIRHCSDGRTAYQDHHRTSSPGVLRTPLTLQRSIGLAPGGGCGGCAPPQIFLAAKLPRPFGERDQRDMYFIAFISL